MSGGIRRPPPAAAPAGQGATAQAPPPDQVRQAGRGTLAGIGAVRGGSSASMDLASLIVAHALQGRSSKRLATGRTQQTVTRHNKRDNLKQFARIVFDGRSREQRQQDKDKNITERQDRTRNNQSTTEGKFNDNAMSGRLSDQRVLHHRLSRDVGETLQVRG